VLLQRSKVSLPRGGDEGIEKPRSFGRPGGRTRLVIGDTLPRAGDELASVGLGESEDARNPAIGVIEGFTKNVRGSLFRRKRLEQHEDRVSERFPLLYLRLRVEAGVHGFREPPTGVDFAAQAGGLDEVDGQPPRRRRKKSRRVQDRAAIHRLPSQPCVLHDVLGRGRISQNPVRDREETRAQVEKDRKAVHTRDRGSDGRRSHAIGRCAPLRESRADDGELGAGAPNGLAIASCGQRAPDGR
jgi:hypothetical protein